MINQEISNNPFIPYIYLDWNIFNKLEHPSKLSGEEKADYLFIETLIKRTDFHFPYSNAHINDLYRGYSKNPIYTPDHLLNITRVTKNLCITQYWGEPYAKWHIREPKEYLESTIEDNGDISSSFSGLFSSMDSSLAKSAFELQKVVFQNTPIPSNFKKIYASNPVFNFVYPRTKVEMNMLALCEDLYDFSFKIKNDFTLYKEFKKFLNETKAKYPQYRDLFNSTESDISKHQHLTWDEMWDKATPTRQSSSNLNYDKIVKLFTTTDLKGYRQDERFANLIDDSLHCFYGAHCGFFLTLDERCYDKAKLVYNKLNINTLVFSPKEFRIYMVKHYPWAV